MFYKSNPVHVLQHADGKLVVGAVLTTHGLVAGTRELSENTELVTAEEGFTKVETKDGTT